MSDPSTISSTSMASSLAPGASAPPISALPFSLEADIRVPHEDEVSIVSHPSARELPGTALFAVRRAMLAGARLLAFGY
jgi:hypothetical protein